MAIVVSRQLFCADLPLLSSRGRRMGWFLRVGVELVGRPWGLLLAAVVGC